MGFDKAEGPIKGRNTGRNNVIQMTVIPIGEDENDQNQKVLSDAEHGEDYGKILDLNTMGI